MSIFSTWQFEKILQICIARNLIIYTIMIKLKDGFMGERALVLPPYIIKDMETNQLYNALHITDIGYYPRAKHHYRQRETPINQFVFIYCVEGKGWFRLPDQEPQTIGSNQCFVLPANTPHAYGADENDPWSIYWIHFKGSLAEAYAACLHSPMDINPSIYSRINGRIHLFEEIYHALELGYSKGNLLYACSAFHHFLGTICYLKEYRSAIQKESTGNPVDEAIHFMKENLNKKLTIDELAKHTGYSISHFSTLFKERTGFSPITYFNQLKIQHACYLLDCTDIKINQVCFKIGVEDCYYFSRLFNKIMGMSPTEYRKQVKG